jgi:uncharacterized protein YbbK (DUF523 family)
LRYKEEVNSLPRPRVGISQCLLGDPVRYDGGHKRDEILISLGDILEWVPVCPELEVGMGAPREPIHLVDAPDGVSSGTHTVRLLGISSREDWTDRMAAFSRRRAREFQALGIRGFVLKKNSPSCGPEGVAIHGTESGATGRGLFAEALLELLPGLPVEDEERLRDPNIREQFLERVRRRAICYP